MEIKNISVARKTKGLFVRQIIVTNCLGDFARGTYEITYRYRTQHNPYHRVELEDVFGAVGLVAISDCAELTAFLVVECGEFVDFPETTILDIKSDARIACQKC